MRLLGLVFLAMPAGPAQAAIPRSLPFVAELVSVKGDEHVRFVEDPAWRAAEIHQALAAGDVLQTGTWGALAILFRDQTQIRVHRNSTLLVKEVRSSTGAGDTTLRVDRGAVWFRARTAPPSLKIETPAATAAIRGTDWHMTVEAGGRTTVTVLAGLVELANALGSVTIARGEIGIAEVGRAPTKTFIVSPKDRPQWELVFTPDWIRLLPVTGLTVGALQGERARLEHELRQRASVDVLLSLATVEYELSNPAATARYLQEAVALSTAGVGDPVAARLMFVSGLVALQESRFAAAAAAFRRAGDALAGRDAMIAGVVLQGLLLLERRYDEAERALAELTATYDYAEVHLARIQLESFRGEQVRARALAQEGARRFPDNPLFPLWLAHLGLLLDEPEMVRTALDEALRLDPLMFMAWNVKGEYHHRVRPDPSQAFAAYRRALEIVPTYAPALGNLATLHLERGDRAAARAAADAAIALAPDEPRWRVVLAALLGVVLDRLDDATRELDAALALDPAEASALLARGLLAVKHGRMAEAVEWILRATVADPGLADATKSLAVAYYQAGDYAGAEQALENAARLDPNDPVIPLLRSIFAQDHALAGRAIRSSRDAVERIARAQSLSVEGLATAQSGLVNLGSAYANLGLAEWGRYYGEASFDPAWAGSHFFRATLLGPGSARQAEATQGLLLEPLAVSARTRYYDVIRRPFTDVTLGAGLGSEDDALVNQQALTVQGFQRLPTPVSYFADLRRSQSEGPRDNSGVTSHVATLGLGARVDGAHDVLATLGLSTATRGLPGTTEAPDADDRLTDTTVLGALGYHHRFGPDNHLLLRLFGGFARGRFDNRNAFGLGLSPLSFSLLRAFGAGPTRQLYALGICDASVFRPNQFAVEPICGVFAFPRIRSDLPERIDFNAARSIDAEIIRGTAQLRHLFRVDGLRLTYGAEWAPSQIRQVQRVTSSDDRPGAIVLPDGTVVTIPFGAPYVRQDRVTVDRQAGLTYVNGEWRPHPDLTLEAGLFLRVFDDGVDTTTFQPDPRAGLAWRIVPGHWLRLAGQRNLVVPIEGSLGPVAPIGLVARDDAVQTGGSVTAFQVRWDAEWHPRLFTFATAERQRVRGFFVPIPGTLQAHETPLARVDTVTAGANLWLLENVGAFVQHTWILTDNLAKEQHHRDLPLVPDRTFDVGVTWIDRRQVRVTAAAAYVGRQAADVANSQHLSSRWTANFSANWQPDARHWSLTLVLLNALDARYEVARDVPAVGRTAVLSVEYRF